MSLPWRGFECPWPKLPKLAKGSEAEQEPGGDPMKKGNREAVLRDRKENAASLTH